MDPLSAKGIQRAPLFGMLQGNQLSRDQIHGQFAGPGGTVDHCQIHLTHTAGALTQGAGGEAETVAQAARAVDYQDLHVTLQGIVLQPVVRENDVAGVLLQ